MQKSLKAWLAPQSTRVGQQHWKVNYICTAESPPLWASRAHFLALLCLFLPLFLPSSLPSTVFTEDRSYVTCSTDESFLVPTASHLEVPP